MLILTWIMAILVGFKVFAEVISEANGGKAIWSLFMGALQMAPYIYLIMLLM